MRQEGLTDAAPAPTAAQRRRARRADVLLGEFFEEQMEVVAKERVPVYAAGLGNPGRRMERMRQNGTKVMAVIGSVKHALQVAASGVDVVVAQGHDGGAHTTGRGCARGPHAGPGRRRYRRRAGERCCVDAEGAWIGTAFLATEEAGIHRFQKEALVESGDTDTVVSKSVTGKPARLVGNKWAQAWADAGKEPLPMPYQSMISGPVLAVATHAQRKNIAPGFAGKGLGLIRRIRPARDVLEDLVRSAEESLTRAGQFC